MSGILVIARFGIFPEDASTARQHYIDMREALSQVQGFGGHILCERFDDPLSLMAVSRYSDFDAAERGLVVVAGSTLREKLTTDHNMVADVGRFEIHHESGQSGMGADLGEVVSATIRNAEPGFGEELSENLKFTFAELAVIPGFWGHTVGHHETLPEQTLSLAAWDRPDSFAMSLPDGRIHDVVLYRRIV